MFEAAKKQSSACGDLSRLVSQGKETLALNCYVYPALSYLGYLVAVSGQE